MAKFELEQNGYNRQQVDEYIASLSKRYEVRIFEQKDTIYGLKNELENTRSSLETYQNKEKQISKALVYAVEKAEDIESRAEEQAETLVRDLKTLYVQWDNILSQVEVEYAESKKDTYLQKMITELREGLDEVLSTKDISIKADVRTKLKDSGDYVKNILNKMDYIVSSAEKDKKQLKEDTFSKSAETKKVEEPKVRRYQSPVVREVEKERVVPKVDTLKSVVRTEKAKVEAVKEKVVAEPKVAEKEHKEVDMTKVMQQHKKENDRIGKIGGRLQSFMKLNGSKNYAESYLNSNEDVEQSAYARNFLKKNAKADESPFNYAYPAPNDSGFDLKEALNPKEDLDEIMKSFDFYQGDKK